MSTDAVTRNGVTGERPGRDAMTGVNLPPGASGGPRRKKHRPEPEFRSYYDQPILNKPTWEAPDIAGYLFLGGLAGASSVIAAAADLTGRPGLARATKLGSAAAGQLSLVALVHDLGRPGRFLNMLRVFKVTSPMSIGSWLLSGFVPAATVAAVAEVTGMAPRLNRVATAGAAALGPSVASYTAVLISNTAVPAWHEGHRLMPFVFTASALSSGCGLGLLGAPHAQARVLAPTAGIAGLTEVALTKVMGKRMGMVEEAYHKGKAGHYLKAADVLTTVGSAVALVAGRRNRAAAAVSGACLLAGAALTRFGIFEAGVASAVDPKYTVVPQRERLAKRQAQPR